MPPIQLHREALEQFLVTRLREAGVWQGNESDGINAFRTSIDQPGRVRVWLRLWMIEDQSLRIACIELRAAPGGTWSWTIYFDPLASSDPLRPFRASQAKNLYEHLSDPGEAEWEHVVSGVIEG